MPKITIKFEDGSERELQTDTFVLTIFDPDEDVPEAVTPRTFNYPPDQAWPLFEAARAVGTMISRMPGAAFQATGQAMVLTIDKGVEMIGEARNTLLSQIHDDIIKGN